MSIFEIWNGDSGKVIVSSAGIALFNAQWPASTLRSSRSYWFEFDDAGNLIDADCPASDDGPAATALAEDCLAFLDFGVMPDWAGLSS